MLSTCARCSRFNEVYGYYAFTRKVLCEPCYLNEFKIGIMVRPGFPRKNFSLCAMCEKGKPYMRIWGDDIICLSCFKVCFSEDSFPGMKSLGENTSNYEMVNKIMYSYRVYMIMNNDDEAHLMGMNYVIWNNSYMYAKCKCLYHSFKILRCSSLEECMKKPLHYCGIYSFKDIFEAQKQVIVGKLPMAIAQCVVAGTVVEHETGYRSSFAKIESLAVFNCLNDHNIDKIANMLHEKYEVPVKVEEFSETYLSLIA